MIKKWKSPTLAWERANNQSPKQPAAILKGSPQIQEAVCGCISSLYLTEISWQAVAVSQLEGNRRTLYVWELNRKKLFYHLGKKIYHR